MNCLQIDVDAITRTFDRHKLSPYFALFARQVAERHYPTPQSLNADTLVGFNEWISAIRAEARAEGFAKAVEDQERAMRKNAASLLKYLRALHEAHAKLVVVRLDLGYSKLFRSDDDKEDLSPTTVKRHLKELLRYVRIRFPTLGLRMEA